MSGQVEGRQCNNGCGTNIFFHDKWVSKKSGKKLPLEKTESGYKIHDCPKSKFQKSEPAAQQDNTLKLLVDLQHNKITVLQEVVGAQSKDIEYLKNKVKELEERQLKNFPS